MVTCLGHEKHKNCSSQAGSVPGFPTSFFRLLQRSFRTVLTQWCPEPQACAEGTKVWCCVKLGVLRDWSTCQAYDVVWSLLRSTTVSCMASYECQHRLARWHLGLPFREWGVGHCFCRARILCTVGLLPSEDPRPLHLEWPGLFFTADVRQASCLQL